MHDFLRDPLGFSTPFAGAPRTTMPDSPGTPSGIASRPDPASGAAPVFARPPTELTRFVGRSRHLEELSALARGERLVTLTGPGGIGKTRLALELALRLESNEPVAWMELGGVSAAELLVPATARALGIAREIRSPDELAGELPSAPHVLFLDGCEHLVDPCAELVERILTGSRSLRIVATSREALGVRGERAWLLPPLDVPVGTPIGPDLPESVQLFVDRARDVVPGFALTPQHAVEVAEICRRLDGIPLALELAAARVKVLSPQQILERLDDMFRLLASSGRRSVPRHRTLAAAMDWSYELLPDPLRTAFRRLSVFRGGFDLDAAEAVLAEEVEGGDDVLDHLALLVDRSLVGVREVDGLSRYHILEPIRQYGEQALESAGESGGTSARHARWYLELVRTGAPRLLSVQRAAWSTRLEPEMDNLRAALVWSRDADPGLHAALAGAMWPLWLTRGSWTEARSWLEAALAAGVSAQPDSERAHLLYAAGALDAVQARPEAARPRLEEAIRLADGVEDGRLAAYARNHLGLALAQEGRAECEEPLLAAREWLVANGDVYALRLNGIILGNHYASLGELDRAISLGEEAVSLGRELALKRELATALESLGILHVRNGAPDTAEPLLVEALSILLDDWGAMFVARALQFLALIRADRGDLAVAGRLFGAAESLREIAGAPPFPIEAALIEARLDALSRVPDAWKFDEGRTHGRREEPRAVVRELVANAAPPTEVSEPVANAARPTAVNGPPVHGGENGRVEPADAHTPSPLPPAGPLEGPEAYDLEVRALGPLEIRLAGQPLADDVWPFTKPRELLLFLLLHPRGAARDEISRALWPDASAAQLKNSFHVALHHLRKALGDPAWIVIEESRYRLDPERSVYFDLDDLEDRCARLDEAPDEAVDQAELLRTLALFRDDFAADQPTARWHDEAVDRARRLRMRVGLRLGDRLERLERYEDAAAIYRVLVQQDELHEELHRRLMSSLARSGRRTEALRHYERLRELLARELEAQPEEATRLLWDRIRTSAQGEPASRVGVP